MQIGLDSYRVFYYVAQYRSFTKAAEVLFSNQPNVTRTNKQLEQALGCSLFHRTSRSVCLTPEGEELFSHIAPAMQQIRSGEESILMHSTMQMGTVSIGVSEIALHHILLPVLEQFRKEYPGIRLRILNSNSHQAMTALKDHLVDLAVLTLPVEQQAQFERIDLAHFREVPVCSAQYADRFQAPISLQSLSSHPIISLCSGTSTHRFYSDWFQSQGLTFSPDIEAATADQILPLVLANLGIGFVTEQAAFNAISSGSVVPLRLDILPPHRTISLLKRKDTALSIASARLEDMIRSTKRVREN